MIDDFKKSFNEIIYERTTSPFYGTIITSWLIWNWRIIYLTFFVSEKRIKGHKIDYILDNYSDVEHIIIYPLISTLFLLTVIPFLSNGAFWLSLKFNKWKVDQKNMVDKKQLLSIEQSIELIEQIAKQEERFAKLVEDKNLEIKQLNLELQEYRKINAPTLDDVVDITSKKANSDSELNDFVERLKKNDKELKEYERVIDYIQKGYSPVDKTDVTSKFITLLESYDIINRNPSGSYSVTENGKKFYRLVNK